MEAPSTLPLIRDFRCDLPLARAHRLHLPQVPNHQYPTQFIREIDPRTQELPWCPWDQIIPLFSPFTGYQIAHNQVQIRTPNAWLTASSRSSHPAPPHSAPFRHRAHSTYDTMPASVASPVAGSRSPAAAPTWPHWADSQHSPCGRGGATRQGLPQELQETTSAAGVARLLPLPSPSTVGCVRARDECERGVSRHHCGVPR